MLAVALLLAACGGEPAPPPAVDREQAEARAAEVAGSTGAKPAAGEASPVEVVLVWQGIGQLHRGYFSDPDAVAALGRGLGGLVEGPANVYVRYSESERAGQIRLQLRPGTRRVPVAHDGEVIRLQDLAPVTRALAAYRKDIASRFDLRVASFDIGIESFRGAHTCVFTEAGPPVPAGEVVSPCVVVDGERVCGEAGEAGVRFPAATARTIRDCLDL